MIPDRISLIEKFDLIEEYWSPRIIADSNRQLIKIAKVKGEFVWHNHQGEDELFHVIKGELIIDFRDKSIRLKEGEITVVPKGIEHRPRADEETWILLIEPASTKHTGQTESDLTNNDQEWI